MADHAPTETLIRTRLHVQGVVQGVGFRPFVYNLARVHNLTGFVGNNSQGVFIEVQGSVADVQGFTQSLSHNPPPLARIESITEQDITAQPDTQFVILHSEAQAGAYTLISPDLCVCDDCLHEMQNPDDRRYRYPFINCTNCGPRFTIIKDIPYDRPFTTMAEFVMCDACEAEYHDPTNRRFHAQPNACPDCGAQVEFIAEGEHFRRDDAVRRTLEALHSGLVVAIKGLGGFHLACDATNDDAVMTLRQRKGRLHKPFAVMVPDLDTARQIAHIDEAESELLRSRERPIVLLRKRESNLSAHIAPGNEMIGIMLPYTPLHVLLVDRPLVMTSANYSNEPIVKDNDEALTKLGDIADAFLLHDRAIHVHCDDSVMRITNLDEVPIRRSRGYAPFPVNVPFEVPQLLAVGAELKSTFCLTKDNHAFMSQHIGDMENLETLQAFEHAYQHMRTIFRIEPQAIVCDRHPRYLSRQWAERFAKEQGLPCIAVQHHHAHIASVMAENAITDRVIGFSYDGTGYGDDSAIWGGEVMIADYQTYERVAHLPYMPLPGGDSAVKNPYRLALAYLWANGIAWSDDLPPVQQASAQEKRILQQQLERNLNVAQTSSMGRLFDVVASLIGVRQQVSYEAQAAIEMETLAVDVNTAYPFESIEALLSAIVDDIKKMTSIDEIAGKFHHTIAQHIVTLSTALRGKYGLSQVALSGGVFQNITLQNKAISLLEANSFDVLIHRQVPANDGGLALGQAIIASQKLKHL